MRRVSSPAKSDSSDGDYSGFGSVKMAAPSRNSRRSVDASDASSLLPDGFDSEEGTRTKTSSSLAKRKVLSADGLAMKDAIKVEYGEGCGETTNEALKEAMKDVLQKVVGVYVDFEFRMNNDKIIKDEIITHSNGFIERYKKMEELDDPNGRGKVVTIKAWVKMRDFVNRMKKMAPAQRINVDGVLLDTQLENDVSAEALLRKEIETIDPTNLLEIRLLESFRPEVVSVEEDMVTMRYLYVVRYSSKKYYKGFLPRIRSVLDQIAIKKDANGTLAVSVGKEDMYPRRILSNSGSYYEEPFERPQSAYYIRVTRLPLYDGVRDKKKTVAVMDRITKGGTAMLTRWELSDRHMNVFCDSMERFVSKQTGLKCVLSLFDVRNNVVSKGIVPFVDGDALIGEFRDKESIVPDFMPLLECGNFNAFVDRFIGYVDVEVNKADVKRIKSAEIKLEITNEGVNE